MTDRFDAIVIGGGPAGSISAILLAQLGWRVALVERRTIGAGKTCGHCLSERAIPMLRSIGLETLVRATAAGHISTMAAYVSQTKRIAAGRESDNTFPAPALLTPRSHLDQRLIQHACDRGVCVFQPATARIDRQGAIETRVNVRMADDEESEHPIRLQTGLIIGADGLRSSVARSFGLHSNQPSGGKYGFSFQCQFDSTDCSEHSSIEECADCIHMFITPHGYLGIVRESVHTLHCAAIVQPNYRQIGRRNPAAFMDSMRQNFPRNNVIGRIRTMLHPATADERTDSVARIPHPELLAAGPMPCRPMRVADAGVALVGDAAGYVEPFTGEGMTWAIESAITLAEVCSKVAPGNWSNEAASVFRKEHERRIARRQRLCSMIGYALQRPWLWRAAFNSKTFVGLFGRHIATQLQSA